MEELTWIKLEILSTQSLISFYEKLGELGSRSIAIIYLTLFSMLFKHVA